MARVLITGMSGVGKSAVILELAGRGYLAVDLDAPEWSEWITADPSDALTPAEGRDWVWRTAKVRELLSSAGDRDLFVSGCAENMSRCYDLIDAIVLLSVPTDVVVDRLAARPAVAYGHFAAERRKVAALVASIEPLLRAAADAEIDATRPLDSIIDEILVLAAGLANSETDGAGHEKSLDRRGADASGRRRSRMSFEEP